MAYDLMTSRVRKHRAPNGALRPNQHATHEHAQPRQKAPSAKRCIKTGGDQIVDGLHLFLSESTERQTAH